MPALPAQSVRFASLAGALLLSTALITHLHLLGSRGLPSTISSAPTQSTLPLDSPVVNLTQRPPHIEFSVAGLFVSVEDALTLDLPLQDEEYLPISLLERGSPLATHKPSHEGSMKQGAKQSDGTSGLSSLLNRRQSRRRSKDRTAGTGSSVSVTILIAVTSECCSSSSKSARRRAAARKTWAKFIWDNHPDADIRFVLAQPPGHKRAGAVADLSSEASEHQDLIVIRGLENYKNLPNKSLRLMRYALSSPAGYTHVLKTDDDCYIRYPALEATLLQPPAGKAAMKKAHAQMQMSAAYMGCLENPHGFFALRNEDSKWHIPYEDMPDWAAIYLKQTGSIKQVPWERKYLAGWGYLLSMDVVRYVVNATAHWDREPDQAPGWYAGLHWEDVLVGLVASEYTGVEPQDNTAFVAAWKGCSSATAVRHLDVEAPQLFQSLYQMELRGEWSAESVRCSEGQYAVDDYWSWKGWRDGLAGVQALGDVGR